jgi:hypothetical protein
MVTTMFLTSKNLTNGLILLFVLITLLGIPKEGHVSGSFSEFYGEKEYLVHYDNQRHKIYTRDTNVGELYQEFRQEFLSGMAAKAGKFDELVQKAKMKKIALAAIHLEWPEVVAKKDADVKGLSNTSYPLLLSLPVSDGQYGGLYHFKFALTAPIKEPEVKWLREQINQILYEEPREDVVIPPVDLAEYQLPSVYKHYEKHSLYLGAMFKTTGEVTTFYQKQLQKIMDNIAQVVGKDVARADFENEMEIKIILMTKALKKRGNPDASVFNPWGPMVDRLKGVEFSRPRYQNENMLISTMFATKKDGWGKIATHIPKLIGKTLQQKPEHILSVKTDTLLIKLGETNIDSNVFYELGEMKNDRVINALVEFLYADNHDSSYKSVALDALRKIVGKNTSDKIVGRVASFYQTIKSDYSMQNNVLQVFGAIPTSASSDALIGIYKVSSISDTGDPYFLRQEIFRALENIGTPAMIPLEKALKDNGIKKDEKRVKEINEVIAEIQKRQAE